MPNLVICGTLLVDESSWMEDGLQPKAEAEELMWNNGSWLVEVGKEMK